MDGKSVGRARKTLKKAYLKAGSWRALADQLKLNPAYVYDFVVHGKEPSAMPIRIKLGLERPAPHPERYSQAVAFLKQRDPGFPIGGSRSYTRAGKPADRRNP